MTDLLLLNNMPLNQDAAKILAKTDWSLDRKSNLAAAQLMLWALDNQELDEPAAWAVVSTVSDLYMDWAELIRDMEKKQPNKLMQYLMGDPDGSGETSEPDLEGMDPQEAAAELVETLINTMQADSELP